MAANGDTVADQGSKGHEEGGRLFNNENEEGLLGTGPYDREDEEADRIYADVDLKVSQRQRLKRARVDDGKEAKEEVLSVHDQFSDLKHGLSQITEDEWLNIPEPGDLRAAGRKLKKSKQPELYGPTSDMLIKSAQNQLQSHIDTPISGLASTITPSGDGGGNTDFRQISKARDDLLKARLDQASHDSVSGKTTIDPKGYLTDLSSTVLKSEAEVGDIKKARELLKSVLLTNPKHAPGWIAAARVEEIDGKLKKACSIIARGCEECPKSEDVWLEAARLNPPDLAKIVLANAVRQIPESINIWLEAMNLEADLKAKKRVIRKALEFIPNSAKLWRAAVEMESDPEDARILLSRAVECAPSAVDLWLALARLETYENAQKVLNISRRSCPNNPDIWIAAARLEESAGHYEKVDMIIGRAVSTLSERGAVLTREAWIAEAENCERASSIRTCHAIINTTIDRDVDAEDREDIWTEDANACVKRGSIETARAIYGHALQQIPDDPALWQQAILLEKEHGQHETLDALVQQAVRNCPMAEVLWLMGAKERWLAGNLDGARSFLTEAFKANPNSEQIWLAAIKLEIENGEYERGRLLSKKARELTSSQRIWLRSITLERNLKNIRDAISLIDQALKLYPKFDKLYMVQGQIFHSQGNVEKAKEAFSVGTNRCPKSIPLWTLLAQVEQQTNNVMRARAILDKARIANPKNPQLWLEAIRLELYAKNETQARTLMSKSLLECPKSGILWAKSIFMEPRSTRKSKLVDALKKNETDPHVLVAGARLFQTERNIDKARSWFTHAVTVDPDLGDSWIWFYKFEIQYGTDEQKNNVLSRCKHAEPHHGEYWQKVAKDPGNWRKTIPEVLKLAASIIE